ncbi:hypothetical protein [Bythopirellula goksoeyrii]|uniref:Uncharacterized protein n=1 Tax=Bythopirellula goksoeyrii TaxID=1400387 RepID=A0A5B9QD45_9BACT|nr:hypothetical protein [Bythopirellula goksoeyrii]QEG35540.1 hypothetical protein Pr1d_28410 [Bythopirellula goksoeyrii]
MSVEDHPKKVLLLASLLVLLVFLLMPRWKYGDVSKLTYEISTALYSCCNLQDETRLATIDEQIQAASEGSQLTAKEARWLQEILDLAQEGNWQEAGQNARNLMQDQVRYP